MSLITQYNHPAFSNPLRMSDEITMYPGDILKDEVNRPSHYTNGDIECIQAIKAALTPEEFRGFCKGNVIKYTWRERLKTGAKCLQKAQWYLNKLIEVISVEEKKETITHKPCEIPEPQKTRSSRSPKGSSRGNGKGRKSRRVSHARKT